jgi:stage III sporulation protein AA
MPQALAQVLPYLPAALRPLVQALPPQQAAALEEIRCTLGAPLMLRFHTGEAYVAADGGSTADPRAALICDAELLRRLVLLLSDSSFYALEEELRRGYITLPGGHRAGLCGRVILEHGAIRGLREISSVNLRLARPAPGASLALLSQLIEQGRLLTTLIAAPPRAGKTTLLRDLAYQLSEGAAGKPLRVGLVDERSELAALRGGQPQLAVGNRTDVLDGCPKAEGLMMLIRSMSPQVLICDEIGQAADAAALAEAANAGIAVIASAHAAAEKELLARPVLAGLLKNGAFMRVALLSRRHGPGTLEKLLDGALQPLPPPARQPADLAGASC